MDEGTARATGQRVTEADEAGTGPARPPGLWVGPLTKGAALCLLALVAPAAKLFFLMPVLLYVGAALMAVGVIAWGVQLGVESAHRRERGRS